MCTYTATTTKHCRIECWIGCDDKLSDRHKNWALEINARLNRTDAIGVRESTHTQKRMKIIRWGTSQHIHSSSNSIGPWFIYIKNHQQNQNIYICLLYVCIKHTYTRAQICTTLKCGVWQFSRCFMLDFVGRQQWQSANPARIDVIKMNFLSSNSECVQETMQKGACTPNDTNVWCSQRAEEENTNYRSIDRVSNFTLDWAAYEYLPTKQTVHSPFATEFWKSVFVCFLLDDVLRLSTDTDALSLSLLHSRSQSFNL